MRRLKLQRPSHTTVVAYLCLFLLLGSGAYAATKIGSKQLKKNAVTTSKIKNGAVTTKKIKNGAVNSAKVADGSLTGADVNVPSLPLTRITKRMRGSSSVPVSTVSGTYSVYPLDSPTYDQAADETDLYAGAMDLTFESTCTGTRTATAAILVDSANPTTPTLSPQDIVAAGQFIDSSAGAVTKRVNIGPYLGSRFETGSPKTQAVSLVVTGTCGGGSGITATSGAVDVIASR